MHDFTHTLRMSPVGPMGTNHFLSIPTTVSRTQLAIFEHTTLILGARMSSEFDVAFLDTLSRRLLNDLRDEVPTYLFRHSQSTSFPTMLRYFLTTNESMFGSQRNL